MIDRFELFVSAISGIYQNIQKIEHEEMEKYGLKGIYAQYLAVLHRMPTGITSAQLCEECGKDKAAVSRALTEMERRGLVRREFAGDTGYRALLLLTDKGKEAAEFVCRKAIAAVEYAGSGMTDDQRQVFYAALLGISENLKTIARDGIPE